MSRVPRWAVVTPQGGRFHVCNRVAGPLDWLPLLDPAVAGEFERRLLQALRQSRIEAASYSVMGNHYHLVLSAGPFRKLTRRQLERLAEARWGSRWKAHTRSWSGKRWRRFNRDLFRLDAFMRDLQSHFSTGLNKRLGRRGPLWAGRYRCTALQGARALQECVFYVELNPVRAGLVPLPERWRRGSARLRWLGRGGFLMPLERIFPEEDPASLPRRYRQRLLSRGTRPSREGQAAIPPGVADKETAAGLSPGIYLKRRRFLTDGLVVGGEDFVAKRLDRLFRKGVYRRQRDPVPQLGGVFYTLRGQRRRPLHVREPASRVPARTSRRSGTGVASFLKERILGLFR